jgi:hypothetical protein
VTATSGAGANAPAQFIGFDSAWADRKKAPGAICSVCFDGTRFVDFSPPELVGFDSALAYIRALQCPDLPTLVAQAILTRKGIEQREKLPSGLASFFSERCYLPQSLLGQLLQIYQDSDASPDSPLSRFVNELLGLDRLDAIETGLLPVADIR